jgi:hypothetical protein
LIQAKPHAQLLGDVWGRENCIALERRLRTTAAFCVPIFGKSALRGGLLALLPSHEHAPVAIGIVMHAAIAGARHLDAGNMPLTDGIMDPQAFAARANEEVTRAKRYRRPIAVVVYKFDQASDVPAVGAAVAHRLRAWDFLGQLAHDKPGLAMILPETPRIGAFGLISRFNTDLPGLRVGAAVFPDDGDSLPSLAQAARARAEFSSRRPSEMSVQAVDEHTWTRGAPAGPGAETVRCPMCLMPYTRYSGAKASREEVERTSTTALTILKMDCPNHAAQFVSGDGGPERRKGFSLFGRK